MSKKHTKNNLQVPVRRHSKHGDKTSTLSSNLSDSTSRTTSQYTDTSGITSHTDTSGITSQFTADITSSSSDVTYLTSDITGTTDTTTSGGDEYSSVLTTTSHPTDTSSTATESTKCKSEGLLSGAPSFGLASIGRAGGELIRASMQVIPKDRDTWDYNHYFIFSCLAAIDGLSGWPIFLIWATDSDRNSFLVAYLICFIFIGYPLLVMDMTIGQFSGRSLGRCWIFAPIFKGLGFVILINTFAYSTQYNVVVSWAIHFMYRSLISVPWEKCDNEWNSRNCLSNFSKVVTCPVLTKKDTDGTCRYTSSDQIQHVYNYTLAIEQNTRFSIPTQEYFRNGFLARYSTAHDKLVLNPEIVFSVGFMLVIIFFVLRGTVNFLGVVSSVTFFFKIAITFTLLVQAVLAVEKPDTFYQMHHGQNKVSDGLMKLSVWMSAFTSVLHSVLVSFGAVTFLSSYSAFKSDIFVNGLIVILLDTLQKFLTILMLMLAGQRSQVVLAPPFHRFDAFDLCFALYPSATGHGGSDGHGYLWNFLYFFVLYTFGFDSQLVMIRMLAESIWDIFPKWVYFYPKWNYQKILGALCLLLFLLALPVCSESGMTTLASFLTIFISDTYLSFVTLTEVIAVSYVYGVHRFIRDLEYMLGERGCLCMPWNYLRLYLVLCWVVIVPIVLLAVFVISLIRTDMFQMNRIQDSVGLSVYITTLCVLFGTVMFLCGNKSGTLSEKYILLTSPHPRWRPARAVDSMNYTSSARRKGMLKELIKYIKPFKVGSVSSNTHTSSDPTSTLKKYSDNSF